MPCTDPLASMSLHEFLTPNFWAITRVGTGRAVDLILDFRVSRMAKGVFIFFGWCLKRSPKLGVGGETPDWDLFEVFFPPRKPMLFYTTTL
jgi:hypothetical protein